MDWKIELLSVPVVDVDRAIAFYVDQVGFHLDHDHTVSEEIRFVQLTPPGSACSILVGGLTDMPAGSQKGIQVVIADADAAREHLLANGVACSEVDEQPWGRFVYFSDPEGNAWALQQVALG
ncbi:VOC family protein [Nocardioides sp.]|uniref:VOC family protein n=1 Tax=Nocardioides sp. TaxID=35761 RepID=UPI003D0B830F